MAVYVALGLGISPVKGIWMTTRLQKIAFLHGNTLQTYVIGLQSTSLWLENYAITEVASTAVASADGSVRDWLIQYLKISLYKLCK